MMFKNLSDNLNLLMAKSRLNSSELARLTGVHAATIKRIRNNEQANPTVLTLLPLANFFSTTIGALLEEEMSTQSTASTCTENFKDIPILTWEECVHFHDIDYKKYPRKIRTDKDLSDKGFALMVENQEIEYFPQQALLIIDPQLTPQNNDYIIVSKGMFPAAIKKYIYETGQAYMQSLIKGLGITSLTDDYQMLGVIVQYKLDLK